MEFEGLIWFYQLLELPSGPLLGWTNPVFLRGKLGKLRGGDQAGVRCQQRWWDSFVWKWDCCLPEGWKRRCEEHQRAWSNWMSLTRTDAVGNSFDTQSNCIMRHKFVLSHSEAAGTPDVCSVTAHQRLHRHSAPSLDRCLRPSVCRSQADPARLLLLQTGKGGSLPSKWNLKSVAFGLTYAENC